MTSELTFEPGQVETSDFPVRGMTCANCAGRVERALGKIPGVREARVNLATERATVQYDPLAVGPHALTEAVQAAGYQVPLPAGSRTSSARERAAALADAERTAEHALRRDLAVAASFTAPLLVLAMSHGVIPHSADAFGRFLQLALATPVLFGPGLRFFRHAVLALRQRAADMNTLVSIGALAAYGYSAFAVFAPSRFAHAGHAPPLYFEAGAAIVTFVLLGKLLEQRAKKRLSAAVHGLGQLLPNQATRVLPGGGYADIALEEVVRGDRLLVRAGERVPNDGVVVQGSGAVDESMLTGESVPVAKTAQSKVYGGSLLVEGSLTVRVSETGADTALARIVDAVERAQGSRAPVAQLADRVSGYFVPFVLGCALLTLASWVALGASWAFAIERFVTVLVIACPCALGLATPAAVAVGTARAAELGVLFKGGAALEATSRLHSLLFDKTGTLTEGAPKVTDVIALDGASDELLALVAAVEQHSAHPVARAIVAEARVRGLVVAGVQRFQAQAGAGASATVAGHDVRVGTARWLGIDSSALEAQAAQLAAHGRTPSFVAIDTRLRGLIAVADRPTAHAAEALRTLQARGLSLTMVTGDREATARAIASELGITRVIAEVRPEDKADVVQRERAQRTGVAMVGDGINDAPALAAADVGIAVASGADVALATADVVLLHGGIASLPLALELARATLHTIRQNLFWAFVYNALGLPLAAGVLFPWTGWLLSPLFASAAMSLSSVSVLANSLRLRRR